MIRRLALVLALPLLLLASPAWADFLVAIGHFNTGTGTSDIPVTISPAFTPKCLIFFHNRRTDTTNAVSGIQAGFGVGFATSSTSRRAVGGAAQDADLTGDVAVARRSDAAIFVADPGGTNGYLTLVSLDADGFTVDPTDATSASYTVHYIALGGTDITNCTTGSFNSGTVATDVGVTGVGFQPDTVWLIDAKVDGTDNSANTTGLTMSVGVAAGAAPVNAVTGIASIEGATIDTKRYSRVGESWVAWTAAPAIDGQGSVTAWGVDGFTFNVSNAPAADRLIYYLAIKGGQYHVGESLTQTDTTTDIVTTGYGFAPSVVVVGSHNTTESTAGTPQDHLEVSLGAAVSATSSRALAALDEDALATSETASAIQFGTASAPILLNISTADALEGVMDVISFDANGVTFEMTDADPAQSFFWYWAAGPSATSIPVKLNSYRRRR